MSMVAGDDLHDVFDFEIPPFPYPGLRPFEAKEWPIFFGRERMTDEVVDRLTPRQLVVVHGDSGSGKSSLIRAGVLPRLQQDAALGGVRWRTCIALPGSAPLWNLAVALAGLDGAPDEARIIEIRRILNFGRDAAAALVAAIHCDETSQICILIDQFEELFAHARAHGPEEARLLTLFLIALQEHPPPGLFVIVTMRSEFLGACARFAGLAEAVNATQYLLPHMTRSDLLRAITEPAPLFGGVVESALAERLVADVAGEQDSLPLIQHGLMCLHRDVSGSSPDAAPDESSPAPEWVLTAEQYGKSGGLKTLLSRHADEVADAATPPGDTSGSRLVEDMFRALTEINADGRALRRPQRFSQLMAVTGADAATLRHLIDAFRVEGVSFLRPYGALPFGDATEIDVSHEALLRCWAVLADPKDGWLVREFRNGMVWRSLLVQAESFERDPSNTLSPATTEERRIWLARRNAAWSERYGGGWDRVVRLIEASEAERLQQQHERDEARRRQQSERLRLQRLRLLAVWGVVSFVLLLAAIGFARWSAVERARAKESALRASIETTWAKDEKQRANEALAESEKSRAALEDFIKEQRRQVDDLIRKVGETGTEDPGAVVRVVQAQAQAQVDSLQKVQAQVDSLQKAAAQEAFVPRIYFHITDAAQRPAAAELELRVELRQAEGQRVIVPGIQQVPLGGSDAVVRCFRADECQSDGPRLVEMLNGQLLSPKVKLQDLSAKYQNKDMRPRHFEVWFPSGTIALAESKSEPTP